MKWKLTDTSRTAPFYEEKLLYPKHLLLEGKMVTLGCAPTQHGLNFAICAKEQAPLKATKINASQQEAPTPQAARMSP